MARPHIPALQNEKLTFTMFSSLGCFAGAISIPSPSTDRIAAISREYNVFLVVGIIEKDGGTLYCSVGFFEPGKGLVYKRRKVSSKAN